MTATLLERSIYNPEAGEDAVLVLVPSRGQICYETFLALTNNLRDVRHTTISAGRKPVGEARNILAKSALEWREKNPPDFTPREVFALWVNSDAWWVPGTLSVMLSTMRDNQHVDALFGMFSARRAFERPLVWTDAADDSRFPRVGENCKIGDLVRIERAGFHFCLMRLSLLRNLGDNPFDIPAGAPEGMSGDFAFCDRAMAAGAYLAVGIGLTIVHIDEADGAAYVPDMPAGQMAENSVRAISPKRQTTAISPLLEPLERQGASL